MSVASVSMDLSASGNCAADVSSPAGAHCAQDSSAAVEVISLVDSPERAVFAGSSQFLIDDSSSTSSAVVVRPPVLAAAQTFLTPRDERSKTEEAAIATARAGRIPPRSSREDGYYIAIPKPGGTHRDWPAMIAYLVTEMEVSGRAVSDQDIRQLKKWAHN